MLSIELNYDGDLVEEGGQIRGIEYCLLVIAINIHLTVKWDYNYRVILDEFLSFFYNMEKVKYFCRK